VEESNRNDTLVFVGNLWVTFQAVGIGYSHFSSCG